MYSNRHRHAPEFERLADAIGGDDDHRQALDQHREDT